MEDLVGLVNIVSKNKVKKIEIIGNPTNYNSNLQKLYDGIVSKRFVDAKDAENYLFKQDPKKSEKFKRLKKRLATRLIDTLFFIDTNQPKFNQIQRAYYNCYKDFAAMKMLVGRGDKINATKLGEKILRKAIEFEFTELAVNLLMELRMQYGAHFGNSKKYNEATALLNDQFDIMRVEILAEGYYLDLARHFVESNATKKEMAATAKKYAIDLEKYTSTVYTQRFIMLAYTVFIMRYEIENDYKKVIKMAEESIVAIEKKGDRKSKAYLLGFYVKKINAWIKLGNLEKSEQAILMAIDFSEKGTFNWFIVKDLHLKLLFHAKEYQRAYVLYRLTVGDLSIKNLPQAYAEQWKLYEAYIHYFIVTGKVDQGFEEADRLGKFRLSKFLNEIPAFSKDKRGGNIQALILQLLFLISNKKYEELSGQLQALKSYSHRYLKKDSTFRSNCFIHMIMQLPSAYYNKKTAIIKAKKYTDQLAKVPLETADQNAELEIVPYEDLWEMVLASLKG